jgi:hypothetical protein
MNQKSIIFLLGFIFLISNKSFCQELNEIYVLDVNGDAIEDTIIHHTDSNTFNFKYKKKSIEINKKIYFFKNYGNNIAAINVTEKEKRIVFELTFPPKYLNKEILSFEYNKLKDNWILKKMVTYSFGPNAEKQSEKCVYILKKQIVLCGDFYDEIPADSKEYFWSRKCKKKNIK